MPIDPQVVADVGRDLTVEFWVKTEPGANRDLVPGRQRRLDLRQRPPRSRRGRHGDYGEYGVSVGGRIAFGVGRGGRTQTVCGLIDVADGRWHHVALTRRPATAQMRIYVDGTESAQGVGPAGDISYRDGRPTASPKDPFLVLGASKRDAGEGSQGFTGRSTSCGLDAHSLLDAVRPADCARSRPTPTRRCSCTSTKGPSAPARRP